MMRHFMLISRGKKLKSSLLRKTFFSNTVCLVGFFAPAKTPNGTFYIYQSQLSKVVLYLRNLSSFCILGARPPMGIMLHAPSRSSKTLIVCAIAGEARRCGGPLGGEGDNPMTMMTTMIDCFAVCSGSKFVDAYVGRGTSCIRGLFHNMREEAVRNFVWRHRASGRGEAKSGGGGGRREYFPVCCPGSAMGLPGFGRARDCW
jgi:hypothetical protein